MWIRSRLVWISSCPQWLWSCSQYPQSYAHEQPVNTVDNLTGAFKHLIMRTVLFKRTVMG
jgi:hypothetical protein